MTAEALPDEPFGDATPSPRLRRVSALGFALLLLVVVAGAVFGYASTGRLSHHDERVAHTHEVIEATEALFSRIQDAETGQRGYLLTEDPAYLAPYAAALEQVSAESARLEDITSDNPGQRTPLATLDGHVTAKLGELADTVERTGAGDRAGALAIVRSNVGRDLMDAIRRDIATVQATERDLLATREAEAESSYQTTLLSILLPAVVAIVLIVGVYVLLRRGMVLRERAAFLLAEQGERLRTTLASIGDAVISTDAHGDVTYLNAVAESLTGWKTGDAAGQPLASVFRIVNEATRKPVPNPALRALKEGVIVGLANHTILISKDGTERPIDDSAAPIRCAKGEVVGCVLVFRDVSTRRLVERQLREQAERYAALVMATAQLVWTTDPQGRVVDDSPSWRAFTGQSDEQRLGRGWLDAIHPDDRDRAEAAWKHALVDRTTCSVEFRLRRRDGVYRWTAMRGVPVSDSSGDLREWVGMNTDVTDRKQAEADREKLVALAENSTDFIGMCDMDFVPFFVNRAGLAKVGLRDMEEASGVNVREFFFPEDQARLMDEFLPSVLERGDGETAVRFRNFRTGEAVWMLYRVFALTDPDGQRVGFATVSRDITERKRLEDNLRQLAADLSEADRRKDEFLATLAHELRNPLAPIRNGLQIMRLSGDCGEDVEQARIMMERQLGQMVRLVDDLLDVSRISEGKLELRAEPVELAAVVTSAVETSRPLIEARGQRLEVSLPDTPVWIEADVTRLGQVFANLLNNAAKYSELGGRIWLGALVEDGAVLVSVRDAGVGIPAGMLSRIFDLFTQVDRSLERAQGGLGIGLTLVKRLVEMHGGSVEARSEGVGRGSEFVVRLPLATAPARPAEVAAPRLPERAPGPLRILVADDNQDAAATLAMMLEMAGHRVRTANDGQQAVETAAVFRPDVILLDIGMPNMNGYEACRRIREQPANRQAVRIALTGWGQAEDMRRSLEAGFDHHLVKPVDPTALGRLLAGLRAGKPRVAAADDSVGAEESGA